jgi:GT2 family glycosyltransferase
VAICHLEAELSDGSWRVFRRIFLVSRRSRMTDRINWFRFWRRAWREGSDAWAGLAEDERDYAVALMRVRGWFTLDTVPQYAPRPLIGEPFPVSATPASELPRLAVVTPSFHQGAFLEATMRSVLDQSVDIDYVVQDGGSTDGSVDVIRRFAERLLYWESAPDTGQANAIMRGFARTPGRPHDIMMFLNADDLLLPGAARFVAEFFARHPDVDVVYGHRVLIDEHGSEVGRWITPRPALNDLRMHDLVPQETVFWRRRMWDRVGGLDESFQYALDWDLLLRFAAAGARMVRLPWFLAAFRLHPLQKTNTRFEDTGVHEMNRLRQRTLGRQASHEELHVAMRRAQVDSALVYAQLQRGRRV